METEHQYKEKASSYQAKIALILVVLVGFLLGVGASIYNQIKQLQQLPPASQQSSFKANEFIKTWEELKQQTVPVEVPVITQFEGDLGKLEPFE
jgi:predicted PurR-regulated permease PerM